MRAIKKRNCFTCKKDLSAKVVDAPAPLTGKISKQPRIVNSYVEIQIQVVTASENVQKSSAARDWTTRVFCKPCASDGLKILSDETTEQL